MPPPDDGRRISDAAWARAAPLVPPPRPHPLGCHRPRTPDRRALDAILLAFRSGCRWADLDAAGICSAASAYRRFREWSDAGMFAALKALGSEELDGLAGLAWAGPPRRGPRRGRP